MAMTVAQGVAVMKRRLDALRGVHRAPIEAADSSLMADVPVYTGQYKRAISTEFGPSSSEVFVSLGSLLEAGHRVDQIYDNVHKAPPEGPYPIRIELYGAPVQDKGGGMWASAKREAQRVLREEISRIGSIG